MQSEGDAGMMLSLRMRLSFIPGQVKSVLCSKSAVNVQGTEVCPREF